MAKYQHTSGEIVDAVQFEPLPPGKAWPEGMISWDGQPGGAPRDMSWGFVDTPEGRRHVITGDWILTFAQGSRRVCRPSVFATEYQLCPARTTSDRGFTGYDQFTDLKGNSVRVMQSSRAAEPAVWIFTNKEDGDYWSPHLNVEQAKRLRDALDAFIKENA